MKISVALHKNLADASVDFQLILASSGCTPILNLCAVKIANKKLNKILNAFVLTILNAVTYGLVCVPQQDTIESWLVII